MHSVNTVLITLAAFPLALHALPLEAAGGDLTIVLHEATGFPGLPEIQVLPTGLLLPNPTESVDIPSELPIIDRVAARAPQGLPLRNFPPLPGPILPPVGPPMLPPPGPLGVPPMGPPIGLLTGLPSGLPTGLPTGLLSGLPTGLLSGLPTGLLSGLPSLPTLPIELPDSLPSDVPSNLLSVLATGLPSLLPTNLIDIPTTLSTRRASTSTSTPDGAQALSDKMNFITLLTSEQLLTIRS
ncbi:hypothetical protein S40285_07780 [Stachybotrys chlorohalonatus IBT 40285]|uniref:Uncharacterized protein n=1 Tax=Stachybotrys chlorohalonatus (strain IBT 40285) TaxID=1283841 RepID=A0A084QIN3_STAC4|nr:hypothetical protein S40285_07780 [Stachybotrys chlorohalonata IBT 40285]